MTKTAVGPIVVINPNSNTHVTDGLVDALCGFEHAGGPKIECLTLAVSASAADYLTVSLSDGSHSSWLQHWTQTLDASSASLDTTFTLDLYGGDCDASGLEGSNLNLSGVTIYPNPVRSNETVYIRDGHSDLDLQISLLNALGQEVRRIPLGSSSFQAPAIPGLYWVMRQQKTALPLLIR